MSNERKCFYLGFCDCSVVLRFPCCLFQALLLPELRENFKSADDAASVFPSNKWHNRLLLKATIAALDLPAAEASKFLHLRIPFPSGKTKKGYIVKPVFRYLKQTVSYFYTTIRVTAVKEFVDSLHERSGNIIGHLYKPPNAKRARVVLTAEEATTLVSVDSLMDDLNAWNAVLDALAAVIKRFSAGDTFKEDNPLDPNRPRPVCLLGHLALVMVKIHEHLKRVAGLHADQRGMNAGHRGVWKALLASLNLHFLPSSAPQRGIRLRDGEYVKRATVEDEEGEGDGLADFGSDESDNDGGEDV